MHYAKPFAYIIFFDSKAALEIGYFYIHLTDATSKHKKVKYTCSRCTASI